MTPFPCARRIGISVSRRTQVTEPVLRTPLRLWESSSTNSPSPSLPPVSAKKRPRRASHEGGHSPQGHHHFSRVPTPESTDTLLLCPPPAHARPPQRRPDQTPPPPRARRASHAARRVREEEEEEEGEMKPKSLPFIAFEHKRCVPSFPRPRSRRAVAASSAARR